MRQKASPTIATKAASLDLDLGLDDDDEEWANNLLKVAFRFFFSQHKELANEKP